VESGRLHESVLTYTAAGIDDQELRLDYTVEVSSAREEPRSKQDRSAIVEVAALKQRPELPVDEFPVRRVAVRPVVESDWSGMLIIAPRHASSESDMAPSSPRLWLDVDEPSGRHVGFRLCPVSDPECEVYFHSAALYRSHISWWVYPLAPLAFGIDVGILPFQAVTLPFLLYFGD
jgi:hypothetical protein